MKQREPAEYWRLVARSRSEQDPSSDDAKGESVCLDHESVAEAQEVPIAARADNRLSSPQTETRRPKQASVVQVQEPVSRARIPDRTMSASFRKKRLALAISQHEIDDAKAEEYGELMLDLYFLHCSCILLLIPYSFVPQPMI
jgi:hypothetical protein